MATKKQIYEEIKEIAQCDLVPAWESYTLLELKALLRDLKDLKRLFPLLIAIGLKSNSEKQAIEQDEKTQEFINRKEN